MAIIKGKNPVVESLHSGVEINKVLIQDGEGKRNKLIISLLKEKKIPYSFVNSKKMDQIVKNHQGVIAYSSSIKYYDIDDIIDEKRVVILDGITDDYNLGAIIRSAISFGIKAVVIPKRRSASANDVVYKTSAGAISKAKVVRVTNISRTIDKLKECGFWVYGTSLQTDHYLEGVDFSDKSVIIIGSEGKGISRMVENKCDYLFKIKIADFESLNASVAAGICFYEMSKTNRILPV